VLGSSQFHRFVTTPIDPISRDNSTQQFGLHSIGLVNSPDLRNIPGIVFISPISAVNFCLTVVTGASAMPFDWQAELAVPASLPSTPSTTAVPAPQPPLRSFAQALVASHGKATNDNLPQPTIRGETLSIRITQPIYEQEVNVCKRNLRGRLVLNKGDKPYASKKIEDKLRKQWKTVAPWTLLSLGRGFYEFFFATESDLQIVWAMRTVNLKPGLLRLFEWSVDFDMHNHRNTHAQVWIRLMALPQEYWVERTLREIASAVGTPLVLDNATLKRHFGHYARILVDIDFSKNIFHKILVEREGGSYSVEVAYERIPYFCSHCQTLGHDVTNCRWLYPRKEHMSKDKVAKGKTQIPTKKPQWVPTKENPSGIGSSIAFAAPKPTEPQINMTATDGSTSTTPTLA